MITHYIQHNIAYKCLSGQPECFKKYSTRVFRVKNTSGGYEKKTPLLWRNFVKNESIVGNNIMPRTILQVNEKKTGTLRMCLDSRGKHCGH